MKIHIKKGKHYQPSLSRFWYRFVPFRYKAGKVLTFKARIHTEPYDIRPDADQSDIHKLFGINLNFYRASNVNSVMVGFQADPTDGCWNLCIYGNEDKAFSYRPMFPSKPGDEIKCEFRLVSRNSIELTIYVNEKRTIQTPYVYIWNNARINFPSIILPWHGGEDSDKNGIGGVAPVDLYIDLKINK